MDSIVHKAVIKVDEKGTTAAASSSAGLRLRSESASMPLILDHPFLFMVMSEDDLICFAGICAHPSEE